MEVTYYGHSCFKVATKDKALLFDPFITGNELATHVKVSDVSADIILLSHAHGDHTGDLIELAKRTRASVIANYEVCTWLTKNGITNTHGMNHGGNHNFGFGRLKMVNAIHSSTFPDGSPGGNPGGFVVQLDDKCFYYAGDTALTYDMKLIAEEFRIDFAFLCIGDNFTMGIRDALKAAEFVGTKRIIGMHYDTFPPIRIDHEEALNEARAGNKQLTLMKIGDTLVI